MKPKSRTLTEQELEIMKVVWERETATVRDVYEALRERKAVAYTTVMTMMNILEGKGHLVKRPEGRAYVYAPAHAQTQVISGMVRPTAGQIIFNGEDITALPVHEIVTRGIVHVPEGRRLFGDMTVLENLQLGSTHSGARASRTQGLEKVYALFPILAERRAQLAGTLSGGQQQMVAIGRGRAELGTIAR